MLVPQCVCIIVYVTFSQPPPSPMCSSFMFLLLSVAVETELVSMETAYVYKVVPRELTISQLSTIQTTTLPYSSKHPLMVFFVSNIPVILLLSFIYSLVYGSSLFHCFLIPQLVYYPPFFLCSVPPCLGTVSIYSTVSII